MKNPILIFSPFALEVQNLLQNFSWSKEGGDDLHTGPSHSFILVTSGQGKLNTALQVQKSIYKYQPHGVIMIGSAGFLIPVAPAILAVNKSIEIDFKGEGKKRPEFFLKSLFAQKVYGDICQGAIISQDQNVEGREERMVLHHKWQANYASWESAAFAKTAQFLNIPCAEIRFGVDFEKVVNFKVFKKELLLKSEWQKTWFQKLREVNIVENC